MFYDRIDAGKKLSEKLIGYNKSDSIVIGIPRGGVVVASEISKHLKLTLVILVVRKLGYPIEPEFGFGAISENDSTYINESVLDVYKLSDEDIDEVKSKEKIELERRLNLYRKGKVLPSLKDRIVILVDDGLATGVSAKAAIMSVKKNNPKEIIFAVPVASKDTYSEVEKLVDEIICLVIDKNLQGIGSYYKDFNQVTDKEVLDLLNSQII